MGHWIVDVAKPVTARIQVIFHPNLVTGNEATIMLKVGEKVLQRTAKAGSLRFDDIELSKGEVRLEAIRREAGKDVGAYQLIVTTGTEAAKS